MQWTFLAAEQAQSVCYVSGRKVIWSELRNIALKEKKI